MSSVPVKPTLASPSSATLTRVALDCRLSTAEVLHVLALRDPLPFALTGRWGRLPAGGAIIGSDPLRVAGQDEDPFDLLDAVPTVAAGESTPSGAVGGGWFGWLGYRLAARVERIPLNANRPAALPDFHLAYYDNVLRRDGDGRWWFEALVSDDRRQALSARLVAAQDF